MARNIPKTTTGKGANYRKTKAGAGMTAKGVAAHRRANPGSKLKTAVTTPGSGVLPSFPFVASICFL